MVTELLRFARAFGCPARADQSDQNGQPNGQEAKMFSVLERDSAAKANGSGHTDFRKQLRWLCDNPPENLARLMTISPAMAQIMMERNADEEWKNRPQSDAAVERYAKVMASGHWVTTGEPIIFSNSGRLLNGQHRLMACLESGCAFQSLVVFGIAEDAFAYMDIGTRRTAGHIFSINGVIDPNTIAAACRWVWAYENNQIGHGRATKGGNIEIADLFDFYLRNMRIEESLPFGRKVYADRLMSISLATAMHYICAQKARGQANDFFEKLATGVGFTAKSDPVYKLRQRLLEASRANGESLSPTYIAAYTVQAWNAVRNGEARSLFRWRGEQNPDQRFPRAV